MVLTSNRTRELHDALKRRCLYHWIDYPERRARAGDRPRADPRGARGDRRAASSTAVGRLREQGDLYKLPGVGETIVWAQALLALGDDADLEETLGARSRSTRTSSGCASERCSRVSELPATAVVARAAS